MTETTEHPFADEQAAEYALGVQTAAERAAAERRIDTDPAFASEVFAWNERLIPMIDAVPPVSPSRVVWLRIRAQLGLTQGATKVGAWNNISIWRAATGVFAATAAATLAFVVLTPTTVTTPSRVDAPVVPSPAGLTSVGMLKPDADAPASFVITFDQASERLIIAPVVGPSQAGHSYELWLLPDGTAPVSIGVLDGAGVVTLDARRLVGVGGGSLALAISVEPRGGSPTGLPTGPVIASGQLQPL